MVLIVDIPDSPTRLLASQEQALWIFHFTMAEKVLNGHEHRISYRGLFDLVFVLFSFRSANSVPKEINEVYVDQEKTFSSVAQSCPTLCDPMNRSMPGLPVHHQLPEFTQIHIHWVSDAIQPSHPLSTPSSPASNPSQHQGLFQSVNSSHEVAKVLEFQLQHQSFHEHPGLIIRMYWLDLLAVQGTLKSLLHQKHQFFGTRLTSQSSSHIHTWPLEKP